MVVHPINDEVRGLPRCVWLQDAHLGDLLNAVSLLLQEVCPAFVMLKPSANVRASFIDGSRPWAASRSPEAPESKLCGSDCNLSTRAGNSSLRGMAGLPSSVPTRAHPTVVRHRFGHPPSLKSFSSPQHTDTQFFMLNPPSLPSTTGGKKKKRQRNLSLFVSSPPAPQSTSQLSSSLSPGPQGFSKTIPA